MMRSPRNTQRSTRHAGPRTLNYRPRGARGIAPLIAAAVAAGALRAGVGLLTGRKEANRQRDQLYHAYDRGKARLDIHQTDTRQREGESLGGRGLTGGGDVQMGGAVGTGADLGVGGAHTLGGQQTADLHREQGLEQNELLQQRNTAIDDVGAQGAQNAINSIGSGISTGLSIYGAFGGGAGASAAGAATAGPIAAPTGTSVGIGGPNAGGPSPIASAYGGGAFGVHPTDPMGHPQSAFYSGSGSATPGTTNDHFTVNG